MYKRNEKNESPLAWPVIPFLIHAKKNVHLHTLPYSWGLGMKREILGMCIMTAPMAVITTLMG